MTSLVRLANILSKEVNWRNWNVSTQSNLPNENEIYIFLLFIWSFLLKFADGVHNVVGVILFELTKKYWYPLSESQILITISVGCPSIFSRHVTMITNGNFPKLFVTHVAYSCFLECFVLFVRQKTLVLNSVRPSQARHPVWFDGQWTGQPNHGHGMPHDCSVRRTSKSLVSKAEEHVLC